MLLPRKDFASTVSDAGNGQRWMRRMLSGLKTWGRKEAANSLRRKDPCLADGMAKD